MKSVIKICILLWLLFPLSVQLALCDKLAIPIGPIGIHQIGQSAIIAWKDGVELLIISPSLAVRPMPLEREAVHRELYALEIMPLPSIPEVEDADFYVFEALMKLVRIKSPIETYGIKVLERDVEVIYHKVIEAHDISILRVKDADSLLKWIIEYVEAKNLPRPPEYILKGLGEIASIYLEEGFEYFVFDLILLVEGPMSIKPLLYRFKSETIYYPLRISRLMEGYASITIFIITSERVKPETVWGAELEIAFEGLVDLSDIERADRRLAEPFKGLDKVWLTALTWRGVLRGLREDLNAQVGFSFEQIKPFLAWLSPVLASVVLIATCYIYSYRRFFKSGS